MDVLRFLNRLRQHLRLGSQRAKRREMLERKVEVLFTPSGVAAQAAQKSGTKTPIVFALALMARSRRICTTQ